MPEHPGFVIVDAAGQPVPVTPVAPGESILWLRRARTETTGESDASGGEPQGGRDAERE